MIVFTIKNNYDYKFITSQNQKVNNKNQSNHIKQYNDIIDSIKIYLLFQ